MDVEVWASVYTGDSHILVLIIHIVVIWHPLRTVAKAQ